jgi:hypothetical protein
VTTTVAPPTRVPTSPRAVIGALVRFEGRKMLTHPLLWVGTLGAVVLSILELRLEAPVLNRVSVLLSWTILPIAAAVALIAGWAVYRAKGQTDAHPPHILPIPIGHRVGAILVALFYPALVTLLVQAVLLAWVMTRSPVTAVVWTELLAGPLYVILAGAMAAAMTRWLPHPSTPLLTVLILGLAMAVTYPSWQDWGTRVGVSWLSPVPWPHDNIPYEVNYRPKTLHLTYLTGLIAVAAVVSTMRRTGGSLIGLSATLVVTVALGLSQLGPVPESWQQAVTGRLVGDDSEVTCHERGAIRYCALPGYEPWIDRWEAAVDPVAQAVPSEVIAGLELRQYPVSVGRYLLEDWFSGWWWIEAANIDLAQRPNTLPVGSVINWNHGHLFQAAEVTAALVGCVDSCESGPRLMIYLWVMANHPEVRASLEAGNYPTGASCMARDLLDRPDARNLIHANWDFLTDETTSYHEAADLLGITVPALSINEWGQEVATC